MKKKLKPSEQIRESELVIFGGLRKVYPEVRSVSYLYIVARTKAILDYLDQQEDNLTK